MAGGGNAELRALKAQIDELIAKMEARIAALEKKASGPGRAGGGAKSGGSRKKK